MIYLDFNAAAPLKAEVTEEIMASWNIWANPGSTQHGSGAAAENILTNARRRIASLLDQSPAEVVFTSSATEAASLAIIGLCLSSPKHRRDIAVLRTEHKAVIAAALVATEIAGSRLRFIDVDRDGIVVVSSLNESLTNEVCLVACMLVNNETGVIQDVAPLAKRCQDLGIEFVCDVTQALGKLQLPTELKDSTYFFSGHKLGTPKGIGCLVLPRRLQTNFVSVIPGGGQERGIRGGTENPAMAAGLAKALEIAKAERLPFASKASWAAVTFMDQLRALGVEFEVVSVRALLVPNTINLQFPGVDGDAVLANMKLVEASTGSACNSANPEPSHVLLAMGYSFKDASCCVRFSFGDTHSLEEIERAAQDVCQAVSRVKSFEDGV
jgi:cysteine desulfurase